MYRSNLQSPLSTSEMSFYECSEVTFGDIPLNVIDAYIESKEPL